MAWLHSGRSLTCHVRIGCGLFLFNLYHLKPDTPFEDWIHLKERRRRVSSLVRHALVLALPVMGLLYASWRLLRDTDYLPFDPDGRALVGKVDYAEGDVKRKPPERLRWFHALSQARIYSRDLVRTAPDAAARVVLPDGGEVLLGPNTSVVFTREADGSKISVDSGQVQFKAGDKGLTLESHGKRVKLPSGESAAGWAQAKHLSGEEPETAIKMLRGRAQILGPSGQTTPVQSDVLMSWSGGEGGVVERSVGELLAPTTDSEQVVSIGSKMANVHLEWSPSSGHVEVAKNGDFSAPVFSKRLGEGQVTIPLPVGHYRWRVWIDGAARPLAARGFRVVSNLSQHKEALTLNLPKREAEKPPIKSVPVAVPPQVPVPVAVPAPVSASPVGTLAVALPQVILESSQGTRVSNAFSSSGLKQKLTIRIAWKAYPDVRSYRVVFSQRPDLSRPFLERLVQKNEYILSKESLPALKVFYRIEAVLADGRIGKSAITPFVFDFSPPRLVAPPADFVIASQGADEGEGSVMMTWEKTNYTEAYRIEIARDPQFKKVIQRKELKENFVLMRRPSRGEYYWRVRSLAPPVESDPAAVRHFTVR